ncbi:hypothetical protein PoB_004171100 [Plakobranchus ocellatus]|uniref:Uncharacterized protein n=1 Tax=Plakobranchus ocellatus TaxID=259542 RepID=A0AAV4AVS6_9GAST|nr:hypothetical protein PoB_004171100 [Plakobranchus ocellatus]
MKQKFNMIERRGEGNSSTYRVEQVVHAVERTVPHFATIGAKDYRINVNGLEKTFHSNLSKRDNHDSTILQEHRIQLMSTTHVRQYPYPAPNAIRQTCDKFEKMKSLGNIRKNNSH